MRRDLSDVELLAPFFAGAIFGVVVQLWAVNPWVSAVLVGALTLGLLSGSWLWNYLTDLSRSR